MMRASVVLFEDSLAVHGRVEHQAQGLLHFALADELSQQFRAEIPLVRRIQICLGGHSSSHIDIPPCFDF
jgi:hypothetical protein